MFLPDADGGLESQVSDAAHEFVVPGAGAESHQTTFYGYDGARPRNQEADANPLTKADFDEFTREANSTLMLHFITDDIEGRSYAASCKVELTQGVKDAIHTTQWATALCE
jgi:hypothetical protein